MLCALLFLGCVESEEKDEGSCYADSESGVCDCFQGVNEYAGTNSEEVEGCVGYNRCFAYLDPDLDDRMCSCGDENYSPDPGSADVTEVDGCPE